MPEGGEVIAALNAILAVRAAIDEASATMREIKP
jgi:hypothetical protein